MINEAIGRLAAATGLTFIPVGDTTYVPTAANPTRTASVNADIVIALSDSAHTDLVPGSIVGRTDISYTSVIIKAAVVIDMGDVAAHPDWSSTGVGPVLLHELGPRRRPRPRHRRHADHERRGVGRRAHHVRRRRPHRPVAAWVRPRDAPPSAPGRSGVGGGLDAEQLGVLTVASHAAPRGCRSRRREHRPSRRSGRPCERSRSGATRAP